MPSILQTFEILFPKGFLQQVIIKETNKNLDKKLTCGEFYVWIGLWFFMGPTNFSDRREIWSQNLLMLLNGLCSDFMDLWPGIGLRIFSLLSQ